MNEDIVLFVFKDQLLGLFYLFLAGFFVIPIILEITWKKACDSVMVKLKEHEKLCEALQIVKTYGCLLTAIILCVFVGTGIASEGFLPGGIMLTALWIGLTYIFQYFGSLYAIKAVISAIERLKNRTENPQRVYTEKETKKYVLQPDGSKTYIE